MVLLSLKRYAVGNERGLELVAWPLCLHWSPGLAWVRLFGWGFLVKDVRRHPPLFSERYGYARCLRLGRLLIRALPPLPRSTTWKCPREA